MMNELIFIINVLTVAGTTLGALALGKEALTTAICLNCILANMFVTKQITLWNLHVVSTDVFIIGSILGLNLLQEYYGKPAALRAIGINFLGMITYLIMALFLCSYTPSPFDTMSIHFTAILSPMPRLIIVSIGVYLLAQLLDTYLFHALKQLFAGRHLVARNTISMTITQLFDTILFSFAALYGIVHSLRDVIIMSFTIKMIVILVNTPFIGLSKIIIKNTKS